MCGGPVNRPTGADYFERFSDPTERAFVAFVGAVSPRVAQVNLEGDGVAKEANIYDSPPELELDFDFFVGFFAPGYTDVTVLVEDARGRVLEKERWNALAVLDVTKVGTGEGTVIAIEADWPDCKGCPNPKKWIDCGDDCTAEVDAETEAVRFEFTAVPEDDSAFTGWLGACGGNTSLPMPQPRRCILTVRDGHVRITARFDARR